MKTMHNFTDLRIPEARPPARRSLWRRLGPRRAGRRFGRAISRGEFFSHVLPRVLAVAWIGAVVSGGADAQPLKPLYGEIAPVCTPGDLQRVAIPNTTIESVAVDPADGSCLVTAVVRHPPADDRVKVFIALPVKGWNGRFRGNGGGGFAGGSVASLRGPVAQGFAAGATDTGHEGGSGSFGLGADGRLRWQEIRDNAYLGIHAMTVVGKALTQAFYGRPPRYSYFVGSSTGGRQGLMEAQRYPDDYDGILSGCPAINWPRFLPAALWPQVLMLEAGNFVSKAKLDAATAAAIAVGDGADGVVDGVIDDPVRCTYDPKELIGTAAGGDTFTAVDAEIVRQIWQGPRGFGGRFLWYGLTRGTDLNTYAGTEGSPPVGKPFGIPLDWFRYFLVQNPRWDWRTMTRAEFELLWNQSVEQFGAVFGTDNPDLTRFRERGGKIIITHGQADQQIPVEGTIDYFERVLRRMGGAERTAEFARLFLMPGLNHGFRGPAPSVGPGELLNAIVRWVEEGRAPDRLVGELRDGAGKVVRTRPLFPYPQVAAYKGSGSTDDAANFIGRPPAR
jgi:feruloyl esterase